VVDYLTEIPLPGRAPSEWLDSPLAVARRAGTNEISWPGFVAGPENRLVASALSRLLESARESSSESASGSRTRCNPTVLALFGRSGTGKTHLSRGVVRHWQQERGVDAAVYVTASDFRRQFAAAVGNESLLEFRRRYRGCQLLAVDDLHQLPATKHLWQELRYTLDVHEEQGGVVVVTSTRPATMLSNLPPDLRSRLAAALTLQLAAPGDAARALIVRQVSAALGRNVSNDAAQRLAAGVSGTASELLGALFELWTATLTNDRNDMASANRVLAARAARRPSVHEIIAVVARYCVQSQKLLKSASRKQSTVFARALVVYLARELNAATYDEIGRALGGRDHTTIMHNYHKIDSDRKLDAAIQETIDDLRRILLTR
jgi:chromosomal replication initiator protein